MANKRERGHGFSTLVQVAQSFPSKIHPNALPFRILRHRSKIRGTLRPMENPTEDRTRRHKYAT